MFDERYAVYLYIIDLRTVLDRLGFLASDDGTYIMTVNADDAVMMKKFGLKQRPHFSYMPSKL